MTLNRRQFVLAAAALAQARGQAPRPYSAEMPNMLLEYLSRRLNDHARKWDAERARIRTAAQVLARNRFVREKMREMAGPLPARVPLKARTTSTIERAGYRIENVVFQSQSDYWIPANVYVPTGPPPPFPAVAIQRGHFDPVRMSPDYQQLYFDLVKAGFVVLAFDPIGQGERRQYYEAGAEAFDDLLSPTLEHCAIGGLLSLIGESAAGYFLWDGMRDIDYLLERPEVDRTRIGCADHTDTGWSALWWSAIDTRVRCAALHAHGRARRWPLDAATWSLTDDAEQYLFPAASYGIDLRDALAAMAPRPLLMLVEDQSGGFDEDAAHLRLRYGQAGVAGRFAVEAARAGDDWPKTLRIATVQWFRRWLRGATGQITESEVMPEPYAALSATPQGSLRESRIGRPVYSIVREHASSLPPVATDPARLRADIRRALSLPVSPVPLAPREISAEQLGRYRFSRVEFLSEPGIYVPASLYRPAQPNGDVVVHTAADVTSFNPDSDDDAAPANPDQGDGDAGERLAQELVQMGFTALIADVRGIGATRPLASRRDIRGPWEHLHNADVAAANLAWSLGDSLFAMRVRDLLRAVDYASRFGRVRLVGSEMGALWALYAAAVDARIAAVAIQRGLVSYRMLTGHGRYMEATSQFVPGVLRRFDLPQVAAMVAPRPLSILDPADHMKSAVSPESAEEFYASTRSAYKKAGASDKFQIAFHEQMSQHVGRQ